MMKRRRKQDNAGTPLIYADLVLEVNGQVALIDVEEQGWLDRYRDAMTCVDRVGLVMRGSNRPSVWLNVNGEAPEYLSRVIGTLSMQGTEHKQTRVAGLICGDTSVWLHRDGLVEVQPEPTAWR